MIVSSECGTKAFGVEARFALTHLFSYLGCHLNLSDVNSAGPPTVFTRVCDLRAGFFFARLSWLLVRRRYADSQRTSSDDVHRFPHAEQPRIRAGHSRGVLAMALCGGRRLRCQHDLLLGLFWQI